MTDEKCETCGGMEDEHRWFEDEREAALYGGAHPFAPSLTADVQEAPDEATARAELVDLCGDTYMTRDLLDAYAAAVRGTAEARWGAVTRDLIHGAAGHRFDKGVQAVWCDLCALLATPAPHDEEVN